MPLGTGASRSVPRMMLLFALIPSDMTRVGCSEPARGKRESEGDTQFVLDRPDDAEQAVHTLSISGADPRDHSARRLVECYEMVAGYLPEPGAGRVEPDGRVVLRPTDPPRDWAMPQRP